MSAGVALWESGGLVNRGREKSSAELEQLTGLLEAHQGQALWKWQLSPGQLGIWAMPASMVFPFASLE